METKNYCGDCFWHRLERDKNGSVTGSHVCLKWKSYRTEWQGCDAFFLNLTDVEVKDGQA